MLTQLNPPIPLDTPKGKGLAHFIIDYGPEHDLMWVTFIDATGECWTWPNPQIRAQQNITMGRVPDKAPKETPTLMNGHHGHSNGHANGHSSANPRSMT